MAGYSWVVLAATLLAVACASDATTPPPQTAVPTVNSAPSRIGDASYADSIRNTTGLVEVWPLREASGSAASGLLGYSNATFAGSYTRNVAGGDVNEPQMPSTTFTSTARATASGNNLTPGDTFSVEVWFKRATLGTDQILVRANASNDYEVRVMSTNTIALRKVGVGTIYETSSTYADTSWHHLVVTKTGSTRAIYVDGAEVSASGVNATIVDSNADVLIGHSTTGFVGTMQFVAIYSVALSATTVLAHYNDAVTLVPDEVESETDVNDAGHAVYVEGGNNQDARWGRRRSTDPR